MFILIIESTSMGHIDWQTDSKVASDGSKQTVLSDL